MKCIVRNCKTFFLIATIAGILVAAFTAVGQTSEVSLRPRGGNMNKVYNETEAANLKRVKEGFDAWKNGTGSPYQLLDENVSWTIVGASFASKEYTSRKAFIDKVITPFNQRMSKPLIPTIKNIYADGDTVIVFFDAEGIAKDNNIYRNTYTWFLRFKGDRIDRAVAFFDSIHFNDLWTRVSATD